MSLQSMFYSGSQGTGGGRPGEKGAGGVREKRWGEAGFPRWRQVGVKGENYATLCNILQSKKCKEVGANKYRAGTGIKGYGNPPPPPSIS